MMPDSLRSPIPVIDAHVHVYDTRRSGSVAIPETHELHRPTLPEHLRAIAEPLGVCGVLVIEVSANLQENQWLLDLARLDPFLLGVIGNLDAGKPGFADRLAYYSRDARFRGIRVGTPWCPLDLGNAQLITDLETLASSGLSLDVVAVGGGGVELLESVVVLGKRVPELRIVIDHLPFDLLEDQAARGHYNRLLEEVGNRQRTYAKVSNILPRSGTVPRDPEYYGSILDNLLALFGPKRLMYGSNLPVSALVAPYERALAVLLDDFIPRGSEIFESFVFKNVQSIYGIGGAA